MGDTNMRLLGHIVFIFCLSVLVESSDVVCGFARTKKNVKLGLGDSYSFLTQEGDEYGKNVKCIAIFKRKNGADCNLRFSCDSFDITNAKPATCKRGDFFLINGEKFCDDNAPDITVESAKLKVMFKSHKKIGGGPGAECNIQCLAPTTTETPTGAPSTTTTSPGSIVEAFSALDGFVKIERDNGLAQDSGSVTFVQSTAC